MEDGREHKKTSSRVAAAIVAGGSAKRLALFLTGAGLFAEALAAVVVAALFEVFFYIYYVGKVGHT